MPLRIVYIILGIGLIAGFDAAAQGARAGSTTVPTTQKAWVADFAAFASAHPQTNWLVAESRAPGASPTEAHTAALRAAARDLLAQVESRLHLAGPRPDRTLLLAQIADALDSDRFITDRFVEKIERPYGNIWRESVLLEVSPARLDELARAVGRPIQADQHRRWLVGAGAAGAIGLMILFYALLNSLTRGYFTWRLRLLALLATAAIIVAAAMQSG